MSTAKTQTDRSYYAICSRLLHEELQVAMGCTEPIAIAYLAAYAREVLGKMPQRYEIHCSGNVIKNAKAVSVPKTGGFKGIEAAVLAGALSGRADLKLEVLSALGDEDLQALHLEMEKKNVTVKVLKTTHTLHMILHVFAGDDFASVEIIDSHTGIGEVLHNGKVLRGRDVNQPKEELADRRALTVHRIVQYAEEVCLDEVREVLQRQIDCNTAISRQGLDGAWGECVSHTLMECGGCELSTKIKAAAAAGSEARMNGCALPVVINSGSGNQGMTASLPVIEYARSVGASHDRMLRALCLSNLVTIHLKTDIGRLSAFCGVVCAATGSAAAIAWLSGEHYQVIADTITNSLLNVGGMVCDGAKSSCAAKIVSALESALLGYEMAKRGRVFRPGEGLAGEGVEQTIRRVGRMASRGMPPTDLEILNIMIGN